MARGRVVARSRQKREARCLNVRPLRMLFGPGGRGCATTETGPSTETSFPDWAARWACPRFFRGLAAAPTHGKGEMRWNARICFQTSWVPVGPAVSVVGVVDGPGSTTGSTHMTSPASRVCAVCAPCVPRATEGRDCPTCQTGCVTTPGSRGCRASGDSRSVRLELQIALRHSRATLAVDMQVRAVDPYFVERRACWHGSGGSCPLRPGA